MKRLEIDDYGIGDGLIDKRKFSKDFEKYRDEMEKENEKLRELLQYVANEHLCGSWLIDEMKKQGVEYNESLKQKKEIRGDSRFR